MKRVTLILALVVTVSFISVGLANNGHTNTPNNKVKIHLRIIAAFNQEDANHIVSRLEKGESFSALARERSIHPSSEEGGDIGELWLSDLREEFQGALQGVAEKEYTRIVGIGEGLNRQFYLLYVESIREALYVDSAGEERERDKGKLRFTTIPVKDIKYRSDIDWQLLEYISDENLWEVDAEQSRVRGELVSFIGDETCSITAVSLSIRDGYLHVVLADGCILIKKTSNTAILETPGMERSYGLESRPDHWRLTASSSKEQYVEARTSRQSSTGTEVGGITFRPLSSGKRATRRDMNFVPLKDDDLKQLLLAAVQQEDVQAREAVGGKAGQIDDSQGSPRASNELVSKKLEDGSFLITAGFLYHNDYTLEDCEIEIEEISKDSIFVTSKEASAALLVNTGGVILCMSTSGGLIFVPSCVVGRKSEPDQDSFVPLCDAVGCTWTFPNVGMSFIVGANVFTSTQEGASIHFTTEGVCVKGFAIIKDPSAEQGDTKAKHLSSDRREK